jgi:UDP-galactopyranose mutase
MPRHGYTQIVENMLDHENVEVHLGTRFDRSMAKDFDHVFYSGPIDAWFDHSDGRLGYRTLDFEREEHAGDYQGNAVINYCNETVPWTRIAEHKHFAPWESHERTVVFKEYSRLCGPDDTPYYPIRLAEEKTQLARYIEKARAESGVTFVGRLGTYRYLDMHITIAEALETAERFLAHRQGTTAMPAFVVDPLA